jgi:cell division septum initiation protein DivIVA
VDWNEIERLRVQGFTVARRGYDRREVDKFIAALEDWIETDAARDLGDQATRRKLELVGKSTTQILLTTEKEAEQLRAQAKEESAELRSRAEAAAGEARSAADEYAKQVRDKADQDARRTADAAGAKAKRIVEQAEGRRAQIEAVIAGLDARRDEALREMERLQGELATTIEEHRPGARPHGGGRRKGAEELAEAKAADPVAKP